MLNVLSQIAGIKKTIKNEAVNKYIERSEGMNKGIWRKQKHDINGGNNKRNKDDEETVKLEINFRSRKTQTESLRPPIKKYLHLPLN
jgi:hypothetical protein